MELAGFFGLHARIEAGGHGPQPALRECNRLLDARLVEEMEQRGIVGPAQGSKPREILHIPKGGA